jgi:hypothetical protein
MRNDNFVGHLLKIATLKRFKVIFLHFISIKNVYKNSLQCKREILNQSFG